LVYSRVIVANKDMEPELVCTSPSGKSDGFGILTGGYMIKCSSSLARNLLLPDCTVLIELGKITPYEIAVGQNGRVWLHSPSNFLTVLIGNAILNSEFLTGMQVREMVHRLSQKAPK